MPVIASTLPSTLRIPPLFGRPSGKVLAPHSFRQSQGGILLTRVHPIGGLRTTKISSTTFISSAPAVQKDLREQGISIVSCVYYGAPWTTTTSSTLTTQSARR